MTNEYIVENGLLYGSRTWWLELCSRNRELLGNQQFDPHLSGRLGRVSWWQFSPLLTAPAWGYLDPHPGSLLAVGWSASQYHCFPCWNDRYGQSQYRSARFLRLCGIGSRWAWMETPVPAKSTRRFQQLSIIFFHIQEHEGIHHSS